MNKLIACDPLVGETRVPLERVASTVDNLLKEMERLRISAAVVRHRFCLQNAPYFGNAVLMEEIKGREALLPAWLVTPDGREPEFDPAALVHAALDAGVKIAWMDPKSHVFDPRPWCSGPLYAALSAAEMPLMVSYLRISAADIDEICRSFPKLKLILFDIQREGRDRSLFALLARHANLHLCLGPDSSIHCVFKELCHRFGPHRWVWGMGYPEMEGGSGVAGLSYSGLPESALRAIAHENIERLLNEVKCHVH